MRSHMSTKQHLQWGIRACNKPSLQLAAECMAIAVPRFRWDLPCSSTLPRARRHRLKHGSVRSVWELVRCCCCCRWQCSCSCRHVLAHLQAGKPLHHTYQGDPFLRAVFMCHAT